MNPDVKPQRSKLKETKQTEIEEKEPQGQRSDKRSAAHPAPPGLEGQREKAVSGALRKELWGKETAPDRRHGL